MDIKNNKILSNKWVRIFGGIILYFILFGVMPIVAGWITILGAIGLGAYLFIKSEKFKQKSKAIKSFAVVGLLFVILIGGVMTTMTPESLEQNRLASEKAKIEKKEKQAAEQKAKEEQAKKDAEEKAKAEEAKKAEEVKATNTAVSGQLKIHYINVGQADSVLIQQGSQSMLIDAGNNADSDTVKNYISQQGITQLDYVVGTHPHEDHIGGLDYVINSFKIGKIYMPKATSTTKTFQDVVTAIKNKGMTATVPTPGETFKLGEANCTILGPINSKDDDLNTYSIVIKIVFGNNKFMFTGDAQASNEQDMIEKGYDLSADVLKVGHHGSHTSTSQAFLDKVNPAYAVISVGKGNDYGHPHKEVMERLQAKGIKAYRTDESGNIVCTSDGKNISFSCNPGSYNYAGTGASSSNTNTSSSSTANTNSSTSTAATSNSNSGGNNQAAAPTPKQTTPPPATNSDRTVYWVPNGKSYHFRKDCPTLARSKTINEGPLSSCPKSDPCDKCAH